MNQIRQIKVFGEFSLSDVYPHLPSVGPRRGWCKAPRAEVVRLQVRLQTVNRKNKRKLSNPSQPSKTNNKQQTKVTDN
jgi:hypothetical protein